MARNILRRQAFAVSCCFFAGGTFFPLSGCGDAETAHPGAATPAPPAVSSSPLPAASVRLEGQVFAGRAFGMVVTGTAGGTEARALDVLEQQLLAFLPHLQRIYEQERTQDPLLMGSLEVQMQIEPKGIVSELRFPLKRVSSEKLTVAVYDQMRTWTFLPAETQVGLRYRLLFVPPGLEAKSITTWEAKLAGRSVVDRSEERPLPPTVTATAGVAEPPLAPKKPALAAKAGTAVKQPRPREVAAARVPVPRTSNHGRPDGPAPRPATFVPTWYQVIRPSVLYATPQVTAAMVARLRPGNRIWVVSIVNGEWLEVRSRSGRPPGFLSLDTARPEPPEWESR